MADVTFNGIPIIDYRQNLEPKVTSLPVPTGLIAVEFVNVSPPTPLVPNPELTFYFCSPTGSNSPTQLYLVNSLLPNQSPELNAIKGPNGLVNVEIEFVGATGGFTPITGLKRKIAAHTNNQITLNATVGTTPSAIDRIKLDISRPSRQSPILEILIA
jgi:hypothetical protein